MQNVQKTTKQPKDKDETPTLMVHEVNNKKTATICLTEEKEWRQEKS